MENTEDVTLNGKLYPAYSLYRTSGNSASARTAWYDTWQAHSNATVPLTLALDGNLSEDMSCVQQFCGQIIPPGINSVKTRSPQHDFWASFTVLDLDTLVDCNDPDKCGMAGLRPKAVAQLEARFVQEDEDSFPLMLDTTRLLTFEAIAGHRYLTIGLMEADSSNGGMVSFGNSLRLTGVGAPVGALTSSALGGDLASAFLSPVPEPHAAWLLLGGLAFMALRHTRVFNRGHEPMGA
jgi:hypothetical protein